jgi:hypothetical protein
MIRINVKVVSPVEVMNWVDARGLPASLRQQQAVITFGEFRIPHVLRYTEEGVLSAPPVGEYEMTDESVTFKNGKLVFKAQDMKLVPVKK